MTVGKPAAFGANVAKAEDAEASVHPVYTATPLIADWTEDDERRSALEALHPIGRLGEAKEVAEVVCFLLSDKASFVSGSQMVVDGGYLSQ